MFWGNPQLQGLHVGLFIAIGALVVFFIVLNRTTLGYQVRAVGYNPEAAHYGGINVPRNYFLAMAISGMFAGLAGAIDMLGWAFRISQSDLQALADRLHRDRRRAARPQHGGRHVLRRAPVRRALHRHLDAAPRPVDLPARPRREPGADHPGPRRALRRRRRARALHLERAAEAEAQAQRSGGCGPGRGGRSMTVSGVPVRRVDLGVHRPAAHDRDRRDRARPLRAARRAAADRGPNDLPRRSRSASSASSAASGRSPAARRGSAGASRSAACLAIPRGRARHVLGPRQPRDACSRGRR